MRARRQIEDIWKNSSKTSCKTKASFACYIHLKKTLPRSLRIKRDSHESRVNGNFNHISWEENSPNNVSRKITEKGTLCASYLSLTITEPLLSNKTLFTYIHVTGASGIPETTRNLKQSAFYTDRYPCGK